MVNKRRISTEMLTSYFRSHNKCETNNHLHKLYSVKQLR